MKDANNHKDQKGGFVLGMIVGLLLGLAIALGVALYVAKVPIPFVDKVPQRSNEADEAEAKAHKDWNPNANLPGAGKNPPRPAASASGVVAPPPLAAQPSLPASAPAAAVTPAATAAPAAAAAKAGASAPTGKEATEAGKEAGAFVFFVQAGAFTQASDAEQQRARLAMQGFNAKVYERASSDRTVFRVRIGPFDQVTEAEALVTQVQGAGMEAAVVRTRR
ncbi:MAG: SPOR domain-containing protein [Burkholderiales bacterium]|jgi:cell division protein FtsN